MAISKSSSIESIMGEIPVKSSDKKRQSLKSGMMNFGAAATDKTGDDVVYAEQKNADTRESYNDSYIYKEETPTQNIDSLRKAAPEKRQKHAGGRPKMYEGEQAIITIKTEKRIKDMAQKIIRSRKISMVQYLNELIENDYIKNYGD